MNIDPNVAWALGIGAPVALLIGWLAGALFMARSTRLQVRNLQILLASLLRQAQSKGARAQLIRMLEQGDLQRAARKYRKR